MITLLIIVQFTIPPRTMAFNCFYLFCDKPSEESRTCDVTRKYEIISRSSNTGKPFKPENNSISLLLLGEKTATALNSPPGEVPLGDYLKKTRYYTYFKRLEHFYLFIIVILRDISRFFLRIASCALTDHRAIYH